MYINERKWLRRFHSVLVDCILRHDDPGPSIQEGQQSGRDQGRGRMQDGVEGELWTLAEDLSAETCAEAHHHVAHMSIKYLVEYLSFLRSHQPPRWRNRKVSSFRFTYTGHLWAGAGRRSAETGGRRYTP